MQYLKEMRKKLNSVKKQYLKIDPDTFYKRRTTITFGISAVRSDKSRSESR